MGNTYNLKQILFALRNEYIKIEKQLKELEGHVNITGDIDDISFHIHDFNNPKTIDMYLRKKQTMLDKIRETLGFCGLYTRGVIFWKVPEEVDGAYYWKGKRVCSIDNLAAFGEDINRIIESDFVRNINMNMFDIDDQFFIDVDVRGSSMYKRGRINSLIDYYSKEDVLTIKNNENIITPKYIDDLLNVEFYCDNFSDYYKGVIDNYSEKEISIVDDFEADNSKIEIIEEPKKLILKPQKIIKPKKYLCFYTSK